MITNYNMPRLKTGEKVSWKEAGRLFKEGVANITPRQKLSNEIYGTSIILLGFFVASIMVIIAWRDIGLMSYGLILIFMGNVWTTLMRLLGMKQQLKYFKETDNISVDLNKLSELFDKEVKEKC